MSKKSYTGYLCAANPKNPKDDLERTVMMIVTHTDTVAIGLQINMPHVDLTLSRVSENIGIDHYGDQPIYIGGNIQPHKIHVIHSLDWQGMTTVQLTDDIGITNDISVLTALSRGEGPEFYRACAGYRLWEDGMFDSQIDPKRSSQISAHKWELIPATMDNTFGLDPTYQWQTVLEESARYAVKSWFDY